MEKWCWRSHQKVIMLILSSKMFFFICLNVLCIFQLYMYYIFSGSLNILVDVQNQYLYFYQLMQNGGRFWLVGFMVFNATFNNPSLMSWWSVLLVEETGVPGENHRPVASHWQTLSHNVVSSTPRLSGLVLTTLMVIGIDCTGRYKSNYHTITTTTAWMKVICSYCNKVLFKCTF